MILNKIYSGQDQHLIYYNALYHVHHIGICLVNCKYEEEKKDIKKRRKKIKVWKIQHQRLKSDH